MNSAVIGSFQRRFETIVIGFASAILCTELAVAQQTAAPPASQPAAQTPAAQQPAEGENARRGQRGNRGNQPPSELAQKLMSSLPKTPLTKDRDGDFHIGPPYADDPAFTVKDGVPKGKVVRFVMNSADSKIYPAAPPRRGGRRGRGQQAEGERSAGERGATEQQAADQTPPQPVTFERAVAVYIPPGYTPGTPTPFIVVMDGVANFIRPDDPNSPDNKAWVPVLLDNLIHEKRVPSMVAILINPGQPNGQRSIEYDTVSDKYTTFIESEVLPKISQDYNITFTKDPEGRAAMGESSGAACALSMAWLHPELYRRVLTYSGTFTALQRNEFAPNGAWDFHAKLIPESEKKPLRIWLHVGDRDNGVGSPEEGMRNWVTAQFHMARVLKEKGYPYQFVLADDSGHVDRRVERQTLPEAFEWVWASYQPK